MNAQVRHKQAIFTILCALLSQVLVGQYTEFWVRQAWGSTLASGIENQASNIQHPVSSIENRARPYGESESLDASESSPFVRPLRSDEKAIVLEFSVADFESQEQWTDSRRFHLLSFPGAGYISKLGHPQLPVKGVLVAVPPGAEVHFTILECSDVLLSGYHIPPVPQPVIEQADSMFYIDPMEGELSTTPIPAFPLDFDTPAATQSKQGGRDSTHFVQYKYREDPVIYSSNRFYPDKPAGIHFSGILRDQHVVCVQFCPLRYNPMTGQIHFHQNIKVQMRLEAGDSVTQAEARYSSIQYPASSIQYPATPFESLYKDTILNYESAKKWRAGPENRRAGEPESRGSSIQYPASSIQEGSQSFRQRDAVGARHASPLHNSCKICIREPGIYVLDDSDLNNAGLNPSSFDPRKIVLTNRGKEIPIYVYGEEDGRFDVGDYIEFYGTVYEEDYGPYNVYWLSVGVSMGSRMQERDGSISTIAPVPEWFLCTVHEEENELHWATFPNSETADRFFWERIIAPTEVDLNVNATYLAAAEGDCTVRAAIQGNTKLTHHVRIYLNGQLLEDATWYGQTQYLTEAQISQTFLNEGANTITIELPGDVADVDAVYLNWLEVDYRRRYITDNDSLEFNWANAGIHRFQVGTFTQGDVSVFDITDTTDPIRVTNLRIDRLGTEYRVSFQDEASTSKTYLVLTAAQRRKPAKIVDDIPSDLHSTENGSDYIIITHEDFYESILPLAQLREQEGFDTASPTQPKGMRVKVVQVEDIYDEFNHGLASDEAIRDFLQYAYHYWAPPAPFCVLLVGDASYDHRDYFGLGDANFVPTHLYNAPYLGDSANDTWFVAVDGDDRLPDMMVGRLPARTAAQAEAMVEKIINYERHPTLGDWQRRILLVADDEEIFERDSEELAERIPADYEVTKVYLSDTPPTSASGMIINAINEGSVLVNYTGHGGWSIWAGEKIFKIEDIALLDQANMLPFVVNMTCLAGYFHHARKDDILGEHLVRTAGKGAIATLTPAGASVPGWQGTFNELLFENFFTHKHQRLGTAIMEAKISLIVNGVWSEDSEIYNLLGDAALKLALPEVRVAWDINSDGTVDFLDLVMVASRFGEWITPLAYPNPDVNGDGVIDVLDLVMIGMHFGEKYDRIFGF
jgi:hypothetical protein